MRGISSLRLLVAAASLTLASTAQAQSCTTIVGNLVSNCSFEDNRIWSSWTFTNSVTGWESNGNPKFEIWRGHDGFASADKNQHLELDTHNGGSNTTLWQMLNTQKDREYTVTFSAAHRSGGGGDQYSMLGLLVNDVQLFQTNQMRTPKAWNDFTYTFVATGNQTKLGFRALGTQNTYGDHLDNISVVSTVPEPSTYALMGAGLLAIGFVSRRRRKA